MHLKEATKRGKKEFHASHASRSGDGTDFKSGVPDEQHRKTSSADEGTGTKPGVPDVPEYDSESNKESWGDSEEEDDDHEDDTEEEEEEVNDEEKMMRVTNLEKDLSEIKQVDQYAQALSSIPAIVDRYIDNKHGEAIQKAILAHNLDYREEAQAEKKDYIELIDTSMRAILKEESNLIKLTKIYLIHMVKSLRRKRVETTERKVKTLPLDLTEGRKEGSQARELSHPEIQEEPSYTVDDSRVKLNQEFDTSNNDEQPADKEVSKADWFNKPERPLTPNPDWNKRQHVDFRPPQTWI
nr:hypothetical protein [Tanacetum cinerariifolium]